MAMGESAARSELVEIAGVRGRDEAFRRLADRHLASSYRLARAILGDALEAEDATHDAFVTAWRRWGQLRDPAAFEHWFERILVNTCRDRLRRRTRQRVREVEPVVAVEDDVARATQDREIIGRALARLDADHRVVVALRFYRDLTVDEIAHRLGIRAGTVKSRLHYALRRLHDDLDAADAQESLR